MTAKMIKLIDGEGNETLREMNAKELAQYEADQIELAARETARQEKESARAALLERLGITADEAALLLG
jgi:hypothetical protein